MQMKSGRVFGRRHSISCILSRTGSNRSIAGADSGAASRPSWFPNRQPVVPSEPPRFPSIPTPPPSLHPYIPSTPPLLLCLSPQPNHFSIAARSRWSATRPINKRQSGRVVGPSIGGVRGHSPPSICLSGPGMKRRCHALCVCHRKLIISDHDQCCWDHTIEVIQLQITPKKHCNELLQFLT